MNKILLSFYILIFSAKAFAFEELSNSYLTANEGSGIGYKHGYTTLGTLIKLNAPTQRYIDARLHYFNNHQWALNLGVITRAMNPSLNKVMGYNAFYDFRQSKQSTYHQLGLGVELLDCTYEIRINGYLPVGNNKRKSRSIIYDYPPDRYLAICKGFHKAYGGLDAEFAFFPDLLLCLDPFFAMGPYYYHQDSCKDIIGGKLRLGFSYLDYMTLEFRVSNDSTFHTRVQGVFSINIPFGRACELCSFLDQPVQRQEIIVEGKKRNKWKTNY